MILENKMLMTVDEVAMHLRVHRSTVSRLLSTGALPHLSVGCRKLVKESDLLAFIENQIVGKTTANESPRGR
jgi:excisionase family DNA binding protein